MRKVIAGIEILAAIIILISLAGMSYALITSASYSGAFPWLSFLLILIFGLLNLFAGFYLWKDRTSGYIASFIVQLMQIFVIQTTVLHYICYSLLGIIINVSSQGVNFFLGLGASFLIAVNPTVETPVDFFGINFFALILFICLIVLYRRRTK